MTAVAHERAARPTEPSRDRPLLREVLGLPQIDPAVVAGYRPRSLELTDRIVTRIREEVAGFSADADPVVHKGIDEAITRAVAVFVDTVAGAPTYGTEIYTFYRWLGSYQAAAGLNLDAMRAAHHIATQESWTDVRLAATALGQSAEVVGAIGDGLIAYQKALFEHAFTGFVETRARTTQVREQGRAAMLVALLDGTGPEGLREVADRCSWVLPERIVVAVTAHDQASTSVVSACQEALSGIHQGRLLVVAAPATTTRLARHLAERTARDVALSWAVDPGEVHRAVRWTSRGLSLLEDGVIEPPTDHVLDCEQHQSRLCEHADPALRRLADEKVLAPLLGQSPKRRIALAETMLLWLQTRDSAPALAARLGVHDQTVRHRLRRLHALFGSRLDEPTQTLALLSALESSIVAWRRAV